MELSGTGKRNPCVSRLRHRRLLSFLWRHNFDSAFEAFAKETDVFFHVVHLKDLVRQGRWNDAIKYVFRFVPSSPVNMLGEEFSVFFSFLHVHRRLAAIAAGNSHDAVVARLYELQLKEEHHPSSDPGAIELARMVLALHRSEQLRASVDWHLVRLKAAEIARDLIVQTPEFKDMVRLPTSRDRPHNILPIGSSSRRRRHVKKEGRIPASDLAKFYLEKKSRLSRFEGSSSTGVWQAEGRA